MPFSLRAKPDEIDPGSTPTSIATSAGGTSASVLRSPPGYPASAQPRSRDASQHLLSSTAWRCLNGLGQNIGQVEASSSRSDTKSKARDGVHLDGESLRSDRRILRLVIGIDRSIANLHLRMPIREKARA